MHCCCGGASRHVYPLRTVGVTRCDCRQMRQTARCAPGSTSEYARSTQRDGCEGRRLLRRATGMRNVTARQASGISASGTAPYHGLLLHTARWRTPSMGPGEMPTRIAMAVSVMGDRGLSMRRRADHREDEPAHQGIQQLDAGHGSRDVNNGLDFRRIPDTNFTRRSPAQLASRECVSRMRLAWRRVPRGLVCPARPRRGHRRPERPSLPPAIMGGQVTGSATAVCCKDRPQPWHRRSLRWRPQHATRL